MGRSGGAGAERGERAIGMGGGEGERDRPRLARTAPVEGLEVPPPTWSPPPPLVGPDLAIAAKPGECRRTEAVRAVNMPGARSSLPWPPLPPALPPLLWWALPLLPDPPRGGEGDLERDLVRPLTLPPPLPLAPPPELPLPLWL